MLRAAAELRSRRVGVLKHGERVVLAVPIAYSTCVATGDDPREVLHRSRTGRGDPGSRMGSGLTGSLTTGRSRRRRGGIASTPRGHRVDPRGHRVDAAGTLRPRIIAGERVPRRRVIRPLDGWISAKCVAEPTEAPPAPEPELPTKRELRAAARRGRVRATREAEASRASAAAAADRAFLAKFLRADGRAVCKHHVPSRCLPEHAVETLAKGW